MAGTLILTRATMALPSVRLMSWTVAFVAFVAGAAATGQEPGKPTFKAGVDLVTVRAVVRDGRGRPVTGLEQQDFVLLDRGVPRAITTFDHENAGVGVALLFDVSGSMDIASKTERAKELAFFLLSNMRDGQDEAAIYAFDSALHLVQPFTSDLSSIRGRLSMVTPWGVTSLHDAIAAAAQSMGTKSTATRRRALVVLTDGVDNASKLAPADVSRIASAIDVPVYIVAVVQPIDLQGTDGNAKDEASRQGSLSDLARWTGGQLFSTTIPAQSSAAARRILEDLRHQYLIAFEPGIEPGWHPLEVRVKQKDHTVQARSGYVAGPSRPSS